MTDEPNRLTNDPEALLKHLVGNPESLLKLALGLTAEGRVGKALDLVRAVNRVRPGDPLNGQVERIISAHRVPKYHLPMLADDARNCAYLEAIERAAPTAEHVLDLGTGSGLLAMMAARAGAKRVTACEGNSTLAYAAQEIIAANELSQTIKVYGRHSSALDCQVHLGGGVDLIVTETFGHDVVGEGALQSIADAVSRLGTPTVKVIPARATVMVALATVEQALLPLQINDVCRFDLSLLNRHRQDSVKIEIGHPGLGLASNGGALFDFNLSACDHDTRASLALASHGGPIDGIVQWLRLQLDEHVAYENRPESQRQSSWKAFFWPFKQRISPEKGREITIRGWRHESNLRIWADTDCC